MNLDTTGDVPGGLEAEIARLRTQANAWEQVWAALMEHAPYGWRDFSKVGVESAVNAIRSMAVSHGLQGYSGYVDAFYELAGMLGMTAQPNSPKEVWETQMRPALQAALAARNDFPPEANGMRQQFEAWAKSVDLETKIYAHNNMYSHPVTRGAWIAWEALARKWGAA